MSLQKCGLQEWYCNVCVVGLPSFELQTSHRIAQSVGDIIDGRLPCTLLEDIPLYCTACR